MGTGLSGLRDTLIDAGQIQQGEEQQGRQQTADALQKITLNDAQRQDAEKQRIADVTKQGRDMQSQQYASAQEAARRAAASIAQANEPEQVNGDTVDPNTGDVTSGGTPLWRNKGSGELFADKAKATGLIKPEDTDTIFHNEFVPKIYDFYKTHGAPEQAEKFLDDMNTNRFKRYTTQVDQGLALLHAGQTAGALDKLSGAFNGIDRDHYGDFKDLGNGQFQMTTYDRKTGKVVGTPKTMNEQDIAKIATTMLGPLELARHSAATEQHVQVAQTQATMKMAEMSLQNRYKLGQDAAKVAAQHIADLDKIFTQAKLEAMSGKGTMFRISPTGEVFVHEPGMPMMKVGTDGQMSVLNNEDSAKVARNSIVVQMDQLRQQSMGVQTPAAAGSAAPAAAGATAPAAAAPAAGGIPAEAIALLRQHPNDPKYIKGFETTFPGAKAAQYTSGVTAPAPAPLGAAPAAGAPGGVTLGNPDPNGFSNGDEAPPAAAAAAPAPAPAPQSRGLRGGASGSWTPPVYESFVSQSATRGSAGKFVIDAPARSPAAKLNGKKFDTREAAVAALADLYK